MDTYLVREIEGLLSNMDCERITIDASELISVHRCFKWYQFNKRELKPFLTEDGEIDVSNVPAASYAQVKHKVETALKSAPEELERRLEAEKMVFKVMSASDSNSINNLEKDEADVLDPFI